MTTVMERVVMFASRRGRRVRVDRHNTVGSDVAAFISAPRDRGVVSIVTGAFSVEATVEGMTAAFEGEWIEPCGFVTMWVAAGRDGRDWFVVGLDGDPHPDITLQFDAERVAAVLADITLAAFTDPAPARGGAA